MNLLLPLIVAVSAAYLAVAIWWLGRRKPGYHHVIHSISELGEIGARDERVVAFGVFLPVGLVALGVASYLLPHSKAAALLATAIGVGYVGAAFFPCDVGSPVWGSLRQTIHNVVGGIEYGGGGIALMKLAEHYDQLFRAGGFVVLAVLAGLTLMPNPGPRGAVQRVGEVVLFGLLTYSSWLVMGQA